MAYLERAQAYSFDEFRSDIEVYSAVERNLQLAIEALSDMAGHVIVDEDL
ncbi:MAG: HepT-like ribonuclease domain-containing protein, partial [Salinibacter sp.]